jgi:hypothetical protein
VEKECPHCHESSFGWRELIVLNAFSPRACLNCHQMVRNSGWRQVLGPLLIFAIIIAALPILPFVPAGKEIFLIPLAVIALPMVLVLIARPVKAEEANTVSFTPDPENDKQILIDGWNDVELRSILNDFVEADVSVFLAFRMDVEKRSDESFLLTFPEDVHPTEFLSLIHYLACPAGLDSAGRSIKVAARTTLNPDFDGLPRSLQGEQVLLYLPANAREADVILLQTASGAIFASSFNEQTWRRVNDEPLRSDAPSPG